MRELTIEEMDQAAGGGEGILLPTGAVFTKILGYVWDNAGDYIDYYLHCLATYGGGPYDYKYGS